MTQRKLLLAGAGGWGRVHCNVYEENSRWTVSAVADSDGSVLEETAERFHLQPSCLFEDPLQAIAEAEYDAISVVVRNPFKTPILMRALQTGVPVFTEKPLCHTVDDLRRLRAAAGESRSVLMVSQNYRFDPQVRGVRELIQERRTWGCLKSVMVDFGRQLSPGDSYIKRLPDGLGLNAEMCIHHYDLMRYLVGDDPLYLEAWARQSAGGQMSGWDSVDARIEFPAGVSARYHATYDVSRSQTPWGGDWRLDFEGGSLAFHPYADGQYPIRLDGNWDSDWRPDAPTGGASNAYRHNLVALAFDEFTLALEENRQPECNLDDNTRSVAIMLAVAEAADTGDTIDCRDFLARCLGE